MSNATISLSALDIVNEHLSCGICSQVLYHPVTLFCQHNFCQTCIKGLIDSNKRQSLIAHQQQITNKCPVCQTPIFLPPTKCRNYDLDQLIEKVMSYHDPEYLKKRQKESMLIDPDLREEVKEHLRHELLSTVLQEINTPIQGTHNVPEFSAFSEINQSKSSFSSWVNRNYFSLSFGAIVYICTYTIFKDVLKIVYKK